jgi:hypothetical protein
MKDEERETSLSFSAFHDETIFRTQDLLATP